MPKRKKQWGGPREGSGRPRHETGRVHTMRFTATDEEWQEFAEAVPGDTRERFLLISQVVAEKKVGEGA